MKFDKIDNEYHIIFGKKELGKLVKLEDGFYEWFPPNFNEAYISAWVLYQIYDKIQSLNEDWANQIYEELDKKK